MLTMLLEPLQFPFMVNAMLVATIVGMMFIPGLYAAFQRIAEATVRFFGKKA